MTKRKAPFDLEREAIDRDEIPNNDEQKLETGRISTEAEIKNRKILKVKDKLQPETGNFKFEFQKLPVGQQQQGNSDFSFVNTQKTNNTDTNKEGGGFNITEVQLNTAAVSGLFSNNNKTADTTKPIFSNLFNNNNNKETEKPSLFANNNKKDEDKSKTDEQPKQGLFSGGLFGSNKNTEQDKKETNNGDSGNKKEENKKPQGLFANLNSGGLFATAGTLQSSIFNKPHDNNLFTKNLESGPPSTGGLFGNLSSLGSAPNTGLNFNQPTQNFFLAPKKNEDEDEDGNESDGNVSDQSAEIDPTKSSGNYSYENALEKLIEKNITKFRRNSNDILEKGSITIEKKKDGNMVLIIYRNQIKQILYQGLILKKASSLRKICDKDENLSLTLYSENKDKKKDEDVPYLKDICKIQFLNKENGVEFQEIFNKEL